MSQVPTDNFYTYEELQDFTNNFTDLNLININALIETKTKNSYTVIQVDFVKDVNRLLIEYDLLTVKFLNLTNEFWKAQESDNNKVVTKEVIHNFAKMNNKIWQEIKAYNKKLIDKHKKLLTKYQLVGGK